VSIDTLPRGTEIHRFRAMDFSQMVDEFDGLAPSQIVGRLTVERILIQSFEVLAHLTFFLRNSWRALMWTGSADHRQPKM
jgi:hypothetical protein